MIKSKCVRRTYYASVQSDQCLHAIKERYDLSTDSDAVRLALRLLAESPPVQLPARKRSGKTG